MTNLSGWSLETLLEHLERISTERDRRYEQRFDAQERAIAAALAAQKEAVSAALQAADRAVLKAEVAVEKRLEGQNEFRGQLADQARLFMPRTETQVEFSNIREKIDTLASRTSVLERSQAAGAGKGAGLQAGWIYLLGAVSLLGGALAIFGVLSR